MTKKLDSVEVAADKAKAMQEYRAAHDAAVKRIAALREARLAREAPTDSGATKRKGS